MWVRVNSFTALVDDCLIYRSMFCLPIFCFVAMPLHLLIFVGNALPEVKLLRYFLWRAGVDVRLVEKKIS